MSVPQSAVGAVNFPRKRLTPSEDLPCNKRKKKIFHWHKWSALQIRPQGYLEDGLGLDWGYNNLQFLS